ncbi:MAG: hypothetical protein IJB49_03515 [Clostridia bacterium]|nr:hypothetical protein [Clostridia bacterium]
MSKKNRGKEDVKFLVGLYVFSREGDWSSNNVPDDNEQLAATKSGEEYLKSIGFEVVEDHTWSYQHFENGERENLPVFALIGYMTADMIESINDPNNKYVILHLPSEENWEKFWSYDYRRGISFGIEDIGT